MRLILHIGTEKTATTTLQHFLYHNRAALAERGIVLSDICGSPNNRRLAAFCQPPDRSDDFFRARGLTTAKQREAFFAGFPEALQGEVSGPADAHTMILSSEHLHSRLLTRDSLQKLHDLLTPLFSEIIVLCYFREQSAVAKSLYSTAIKAGKSESFETFLQGCTPASHRYNYVKSFSLWADVFGADALRARLFDKAAFVGGDICADFLAQVGGLEMADFDPVASNQNESLGAQGLMLGQINNRLNPRFLEDGAANPVRRVLAEAIEGSALAQSGALPFDSAPEVHARFETSNRDFAQKFLGRDDNPFPVPRPKAAQTRAIEPNELQAFWETALDGLKDIAALTPSHAAALRALARRIDKGETLGKPDVKMLRTLARVIHPKPEKTDKP